jgi:hypothetical protein
MPHVLHRRLELGQDEGAAAQEAPELEHPAPRGPDEQVVIEEAGVDRLLQEELIAPDAANVWKRRVSGTRDQIANCAVGGLTPDAKRRGASTGALHD